MEKSKLANDKYVPGKIRLIDIPEPTLADVPPNGLTGQIVFQPKAKCLWFRDRRDGAIKVIVDFPAKTNR